MSRTLDAAYWLERVRKAAADALAGADALADEDPRAATLVVDARIFLGAVDVFAERVGARSVPICSNPTHSTACCMEKL